MLSSENHNFSGTKPNFAKLIFAAEGGIVFVGRHEVTKLVLRIDYYVPEK